MKLFGKYFIQIIYLSILINIVKGSEVDPTNSSNILETLPSTIFETITTTIPTTISTMIITTVPTTIPTTIPEISLSEIPETTISSTNPIFNNNEPYNSFDWTTISNLDTTMDRETNIEELIDPINPLYRGKYK